jgi:hypothetical protein
VPKGGKIELRRTASRNWNESSPLENRSVPGEQWGLEETKKGRRTGWFMDEKKGKQAKE